MILRYACITLYLITVSCGGSLAPAVSSKSVTTAPYSEQPCSAMNEDACEAFNLVNYERTQKGLPQLTPLTSCITAAQSHARDMSINNYFSHDGLTETWSQRMSRFNVTGTIGENIAISSSPSQVVKQWMESPGHRQNILNPSYRTAGMGLYNGYWVQCFAG